MPVQFKNLIWNCLVASVLAPKKPQTVEDEEVVDGAEGGEGEAAEGGDAGEGGSDE